jgi:hypothetical protein
VDPIVSGLIVSVKSGKLPCFCVNATINLMPPFHPCFTILSKR